MNQFSDVQVLFRFMYILLSGLVGFSLFGVIYHNALACHERMRNCRYFDLDDIIYNAKFGSSSSFSLRHASSAMLCFSRSP